MSDDNYDGTDDRFGGTIEIVSAYISNSSNRLAPDDLQGLIRNTFATLSELTPISSASTEDAEDLTKTKSEIKKSIGAEKLTSFIDGRGYSSLKRHLTANGYTAETYRSTFGLPSDYPIVHPAYSVRRSELAKSIGLGRKRSDAGKASHRSKATAK